MNGSDSLSVIKLNIARVHDTIKNILLVKKQLQNNSIEAKGEVHSSISRQLEALRSREVWLLDQVDTIQHVKEGILDEQLCHMQHELGAARTFLATAAGTGCQFTDELQATIANLEQLTFEPKEDSDVHYTADHKNLRDAIYAFGHIQTNKRRITDTEGANKKACVSDVREVDHGELCRSLTELKEKKEQRMDAVPAWALQNREWLIKTPTNTPAELYNELIFPPFRRNESSSEWLQAVQEISSLRKVEEEEEEDDEDDYQMAESDVLSFEMISTPHEETESPGIHPYFDEILTSPTTEWLQNPERIRLEYEMGASYPYAVMRYFRDISKDTRVWLAGYEERKKLEEVEEKNKEMMMSCAGQCACTAATSTIVQNIEIENLDDLVCIREPTSKAANWQQRGVDEDEVEDHIMLLPDIEKVCRANETCGSFSECVCDTKCCGGLPESESIHSSECSIPQLKNQRHSVADKNAVGAAHFPYFQRIRSESNGDWLSIADSQFQSGDVNPMKIYVGTRPDKVADWLASKEQQKTMVCEDSWLTKKEKVSEGINSELDVWKTLQKHHSCYNTTDWLNSSCQRSTSSQKNLQQCETWKTVSDHHSNYTEADWRRPSTNGHDSTNQTPVCTQQDVENKEYESWLMSSSKNSEGQCSEELKKYASLRKNTQTKVSDWLLGTIPDDIRGIVFKMEDVHLTTPPSKWLLGDQAPNTFQEKMKSKSEITSFPRFAEKSPIKTWLKD